MLLICPRANLSSVTYVRGRDNPDVTLLYGIHGDGSPAAQKLMDGEWRNSTYAEYTKFPLENLYPLNEEVLVNKMGYTFSDLCLNVSVPSPLWWIVGRGR